MSASHVIALLMAFAGTDETPGATAESPVAVPAAPVPATTNAAAKPDKIICRRIEELGSRLKANKVCMTSSEWAEQRRLDRMNVDRAQKNRWTQGN